MDEATKIEVENFFARRDLEFVDCPLCKRPLLKQSCVDRQRKYPPVKVNGEVVTHDKQIRCALSGCQRYKKLANARRSNPWKERDWPVNPRLNPDQLEEAHAKKKLASWTGPLKGSERFND